MYSLAHTCTYCTCKSQLHYQLSTIVLYPTKNTNRHNIIHKTYHILFDVWNSTINVEISYMYVFTCR